MMTATSPFIICRFCNGHVYGDNRDDAAHADCCGLCVKDARDELRGVQEAYDGDPP